MYFIILGFIAIGSLLLWYFLGHDHGRNLPVGSLWLAFGFGILASILAYNLESRLFPKDILISHTSMGMGLLLYLGVGFLEEAVKFIPLAIFIYHKPYFKEHTDGVIYFAICGLTFGLCENILYTISFGAKVGMVRLVMSPFFHAAATSILGYYLVSMKINNKARKKFILACLIIPIMHGVYDFGFVTGKLDFNVLSFMLTLLLSMGLFFYFMSANDLDKAALVRLKSAPNSFCSNCGKPNVNHTLFCVYCGHHL
jgi:RsiW-degrading membrane proteinase PrsW (M82 family)